MHMFLILCSNLADTEADDFSQELKNKITISQKLQPVQRNGFHFRIQQSKITQKPLK